MDINNLNNAKKQRKPHSEEAKLKRSISLKRCYAEGRRKIVIYTPELRKKMGNGMRGKKKSLESIEKGRLKMIGHIVTEETRKKIGKANSGRKQSEEVIQQKRIRLKGRKVSDETRLKMKRDRINAPIDLIIKKYIDEEKSFDTIALELNLDAGLIRRRLIRSGIIIRKGMTERCRKENGEKISKSLKKLWKEDKEYRQSQIKKITSQLVPNKPEKSFMDFVKNNNLSFTYVGDGKFWLTGNNFCFNPDFIDCKNKIIIEIYGDYWHNRDDMKDRDKERLETYSKYNYKTIIIWVSELENKELVLSKINNCYNELKCN